MEGGCCFAVHFLQPHSHSLATWHGEIWLQKCDQITEPLPLEYAYEQHISGYNFELDILKTERCLNVFNRTFKKFIHTRKKKKKIIYTLAVLQ